MNWDTGTWIVVGMVLLFYLRLIVIQWGKASRFNRNPLKNKARDHQTLYFKFNRVWLGVGAGLLVLGVLIKATPGFGGWLENYWWVFAALGIFIFGAGIRN